MANPKISNKNNKLNKTKPLPKNIIVGLTITVLVVIILILVIRPYVIKQPVAGKAVEYGAPVTGAQGKFGITIPIMSAGAPWSHPTEGTKYDIIEVTGFVNFAGTTGTFATMRLKLNYNPVVLQPVSNNPAEVIIPLHGKYTSNLGSAVSSGNILIYYTWSGAPGELATWTMTGQQNLFKVKFKVIAPDPGAGNNNLYSGVSGAAWLEPVDATVLNDNSGTTYGIYKTATTNENVQMATLDTASQSLSLTVYPGCYDVDADGYAPTNKDRQACLHKLATDIDCNDDKSDVYPGADEKCDGYDNNCDTQGLVDKNDPAFATYLVTNNLFNQPPTGQTILKGVCLDYKTCESGVLTDSWQATGTPYTADTDACDFYDNDCDGTLNEDAPSCQLGGGLAHQGGNTYLDWTSDPTTGIFTLIQTVDIRDTTATWLYTQLAATLQSDPTKKTPLCDNFGIGYLCVCKNGDYYRGDSAGKFYSVDYHKGTRQDITHTITNLELKTAAGASVECP